MRFLTAAISPWLEVRLTTHRATTAVASDTTASPHHGERPRKGHSTASKGGRRMALRTDMMC